MALSCRFSVFILVLLGTTIGNSRACRFAELFQGHTVEGKPPHPASRQSEQGSFIPISYCFTWQSEQVWNAKISESHISCFSQVHTTAEICWHS